MVRLCHCPTYNLYRRLTALQGLWFAKLLRLRRALIHFRLRQDNSSPPQIPQEPDAPRNSSGSRSHARHGCSHRPLVLG